MKKFRIVTIGAATRDVILQSRAIRIVKDGHFSTGEGECLALGSKIDIDNIVFETGGGATNTAVGFSRQGYRTAFLGRIGVNDTRGQAILKELRAEKVATDLVTADRNNMTAYSVILLTPRGERTVLVYRGASQHFQPADIKWASFNAAWLYVTALGGKISFIRSIWDSAARKGSKIMWNPGQGELALGLKKLMPLFKNTDILMLNQEEVTALYGLDRFQYVTAFNRLRQVVKGLAVVTLGADGSLAGDKSDTWHAGTNPVKVVDTTGAGDAFGCGFLSAYIRGGLIAPALQLGTANSEAVIGYLGAKHGLLDTRKPATPVTVTKRS